MKNFMDLFKRMTLKEWWTRVRHGLRDPSTPSEYEWAKQESKRLWSPVSAVVIPTLVLLILLLVGSVPIYEQSTTVTIMDPVPIEKLDIPEVLEVTPNTDPIVVDNFAPIDGNSDFVKDANTSYSEDFSPQPTIMDTVAITRSPVIMRGIIGNREPGSRGKALLRYGGTPQGEGAVLKALRWLKMTQNDDGSWNNCKPAMTGMALLVYLAHNETPNSEEFGYTVQKALMWLIDHQKADGRFENSDGHEYAFPIAVYALCESFIMTRVPAVGIAAEKGIKELIEGQNITGSFNYNCRPRMVR